MGTPEDPRERLARWDRSEAMTESEVEAEERRMRARSTRLMVTTAVVFGLVALAAAAPFIWFALSQD